MAEADPTRVACITGTKGKSTTTALAVHLLTGLGYRARAGGNIGHPPWDPAAGPEPDYWIIETSSFQVPDLAIAPRVVAVTSLSPDHLDWHGTVERYYADKLSLCTKPGVALALADGSDELLRAQAALLGPHLRWVTAADVERDAALVGARSGCPDRTTRATRPSPAPCSVGLGIPERGDDEPHGGGRRRASAGCPAAAIRSARWARSSSSTTACRPTCCRRRRRCAPSRSGPVALLVGGHDRGRRLRAARPHASRRGRRRRSSSPCPTTARASGRRCATPAGGRGRGARRRRPRSGGRDRVRLGRGPAASCCCRPAAPSFGRFADYRERSAAFAAAAARCGPLS